MLITPCLYTIFSIQNPKNIAITTTRLVQRYVWRLPKTCLAEDPFNEDTVRVGDALLDEISEAQRSKWKEMIESTDFTHSSRKAWKTINTLTKDYTKPQQQCKDTADQVAHQLLLNGKGNKLHVPRWEKMPIQTVTESKRTSPFLMEDLQHGVNALKNSKAAGLDDMLCEQIKHVGEATLRWLLQMMNSILKTQKFPKLWRKSKVIAILKPGKDSTLPKSYRPISLLCHTYKLFERRILNRLNPLIETMIIDQQAGFRPGKSTTGQLLNLTQHIEDGYERGVVTGTVFVDLSAAYDTISHKLLLNMIYRMTSDIKFTDLIGNILSNRRYFVELNVQKSRWRNQKNGLPPRKCAITCALQHLHKWPTNTKGHSEFHLRRRLVYCDTVCIIWEDRINPQRSIRQHWRLLREEPFACQPRQDTDIRIPPQEHKSEQIAEHIMVWKETGTYSISNLPGSYSWQNT